MAQSLHDCSQVYASHEFPTRSRSSPRPRRGSSSNRKSNATFSCHTGNRGCIDSSIGTRHGTLGSRVLDADRICGSDGCRELRVQLYSPDALNLRKPEGFSKRNPHEAIHFLSIQHSRKRVTANGRTVGPDDGQLPPRIFLNGSDTHRRAREA